MEPNIQVDSSMVYTMETVRKPGPIGANTKASGKRTNNKAMEKCSTLMANITKVNGTKACNKAMACLNTPMVRFTQAGG